MFTILDGEIDFSFRGEPLSSEERAERIQRAKALSAKYRTELLV